MLFYMLGVDLYLFSIIGFLFAYTRLLEIRFRIVFHRRLTFTGKIETNLSGGVCGDLDLHGYEPDLPLLASIGGDVDLRGYRRDLPQLVSIV